MGKLEFTITAVHRFSVDPAFYSGSDPLRVERQNAEAVMIDALTNGQAEVDVHLGNAVVGEDGQVLDVTTAGEPKR